jgi:hypothetical protein
VKIAIHQPEFLPWLGFFYKMSLAEEYIVFDHVQFKKRYFENRNRIVSSQGAVSWVGVPVISKGRYIQAIKEVEIDNSHNWKKKLITTVEHYYSKSTYFKRYFEEFRTIIDDFNGNLLIDLNLSLIHFFRKHLHITCPMRFSSDILESGEERRGSDLILQLCLLANAQVYLCGPSGRDYLKLEEFSKSGIAIEWIDYQHPRYEQLSKTFVPYMSTLDLLFNHGEMSSEILMTQP